MRAVPMPCFLLVLAVVSMAGCGGGGGGAEPTGDGLSDTPADPGVPGGYAVVDTGQDACYDALGEIACPFVGEAFHGQDAQHTGHAPDFADNGDGTVTDQVTGLMWQQGFAPTKLSYADTLEYPDTLNAQRLGGYADWRVPTIKELYSLIDFRGTDPVPEGTSEDGLVPFIDFVFFDFEYGDAMAGERIIDSQWATTTLYVANPEMLFGVNFADGRIKGYGLDAPFGGGDKTFFVRLCRGNTDYGKNLFRDNEDGTVTDQATGLMWTRADSGQGVSWANALAWAAEKSAERYLGHDDWRLPDVKELQSIVDYTRSPDTTGSAAIDPVFETSVVTNIDGALDYPFFWSSTTHLGQDGGAGRACYVAFGRALGMEGVAYADVHGAGCQRSDPKDGDPDDYPLGGAGPQGDVQVVFNHVRLVRTVD